MLIDSDICNGVGQCWSTYHGVYITCKRSLCSLSGSINTFHGINLCTATVLVLYSSCSTPQNFTAILTPYDARPGHFTRDESLRVCHWGWASALLLAGTLSCACAGAEGFWSSGFMAGNSSTCSTLLPQSRTSRAWTESCTQRPAQDSDLAWTFTSHKEKLTGASKPDCAVCDASG